jgi:DNA-directed RNA polymerase subunit M/transcription elongation factor TFIIS
MLKIIKFKGCKRCGGDLYIDQDPEDFCISCLQCGAVHARKLIIEVKKVKKSKVVQANSRVAVR